MSGSKRENPAVSRDEKWNGIRRWGAASVLPTIATTYSVWKTGPAGGLLHSFGSACLVGRPNGCPQPPSRHDADLLLGTNEIFCTGVSTFWYRWRTCCSWPRGSAWDPKLGKEYSAKRVPPLDPSLPEPAADLGPAHCFKGRKLGPKKGPSGGNLKLWTKKLEERKMDQGQPRREFSLAVQCIGVASWRSPRTARTF